MKSSSARTMATVEVIKKDYMLKRSQMKSRIKSENYRNRWFELFPLTLRYSDGSLDVSILLVFCRLISYGVICGKMGLRE